MTRTKRFQRLGLWVIAASVLILGGFGLVMAVQQARTASQRVADL